MNATIKIPVVSLDKDWRMDVLITGYIYVCRLLQLPLIRQTTGLSPFDTLGIRHLY